MGVAADDEQDADGPEQDAGLQPAAAGPGGRAVRGLPGQGLQRGDRRDVPVGGQRAQLVLQAHRQLDVGQRVPAQLHEGRPVGDLVQAEHLREDRPHARRRGRGGGRARAGELADPGAVELAVGEPGEPLHLGHPYGPGRQARGAGGGRRQAGGGAFRHDDECPVRLGARDGRGRAREGALHGLEVDAQADDLGEPRAASQHLEQAVLGAPGQVARPQLVHHPAEPEVGRRLGVAQHDVGAPVDDLPAVRARALLDTVEPDAAARHGDAHGLRSVEGQPGRQVGHPRRRLGLPVHDEQVEPALASRGRPAPDLRRLEAAAGAGQPAQRRQLGAGPVGVEQAAPVEQREGVRHPGQRGHRLLPAQGAEARVDDGRARQHDARPGDEVGVQDGQPVAVGHRQGGRRAVVLAQAQVGDDRLGVGLHALGGQPGQLRRPGRARGAEQQRQLGVQHVRGPLAALGRRPAPVRVAGDDDVGVVALGPPVDVALLVARDEQHDVPGGEGAEVGDHRVELVRAGEQHQPPHRAEPAAHLVDALGQLGVRQPGAAVHQRGAAPVLRQVARERHGGAEGTRRGRHLLNLGQVSLSRQGAPEPRCCRGRPALMLERW